MNFSLPNNIWKKEKLDKLFSITDIKRDPIWTPVQNGSTRPKPPDIHDLAVLHYLIRKRKVINVLEFGPGYSSCFIADALKKNHKDFGVGFAKGFRKEYPFQCWSVGDSKYWIKVASNRISKKQKKYISFSYSPVRMLHFNSRPCTFYDKLPNINPELIYLDGPDQWTCQGSYRGLHTRMSERTPLAGDILLYEPYLIPGCLVVIDGRTNNTRFLINNLQRKWVYSYQKDMHFLELKESPLGKLNRKYLKFVKLKK